jgi:anti-anti-sigma factor
VDDTADELPGENPLWREILAGCGELDLEGGRVLESVLTATATTGVAQLQLDLDGVDYMNANGLRAVLYGLQRVEAEGISFEVTHASVSVTRMFEVSGTRALLERRKLSAAGAS